MAFDKAKALQEANKYVTQGKIAKAIKQYESVFENIPSDLTLLNVIGDLYAKEENFPEALKCFYKLADIYTREGYKLKAIAIFKKIAKLDQDSVGPLLRLAELTSAQGLAREAREHFKSALDFFERKGQHDQSLEILRKLCRMDPSTHGLRLHLAQAAERAGETHEAVEAYLGAAVLARDNGDPEACRAGLDRAANLDPDNTEVRLLRARQALADGRPQDVGKILGAVPALQPSPEAKRLLLESYLATNNLDAASGLILDVLESNPSNFAPAAEFTARCIEEGEYEAAFQVLKQAAPVLIARRETGPFKEALGRLWKACPEHIDVLELVCHVAEKTADEEAVLKVLEALADAYVASNQFGKAEHAYTRLVALEPENEAFKVLLQKVLERQGREFVPLSQPPLTSSDKRLEPDASWRSGCGEGALPQAEQAALRAGSLPPLQEGPGPPPVEDPNLPVPPVEFDLQTGAIGDARGAEPEPPKEISLESHSLHGESGIPPAASIGQAGPDRFPASSDDAAAKLRSLLDEFGAGCESADKPADDEQRHYNLGVAFREMGLLDEAIGEFQKVVNGTGSKLFGAYFPQVCTLLASCFMDKEMPAIAAKWYLRALDTPGLDDEGTLAVFYDLGMAFEKAGDTSAALEKFNEVYSQNVDYRDVAEKIRLLRQTSR